jgi:GNAT superfamily N-acetyltransferase
MKIIEITNSAAEEFHALADLLYQQMLDIGSNRSRLSIESAIQNALKPESRAIFFLAKKDTVPVGLVFANICSGIESGGDYIWINEIQILPRYRGQGFGKELLNYVIKWSKRNAIKTVLGVTGIYNDASQALFKSENFEINDIKWMEYL